MEIKRKDYGEQADLPARANQAITTQQRKPFEII